MHLFNNSKTGTAKGRMFSTAGFRAALFTCVLVTLGLATPSLAVARPDGDTASDAKGEPRTAESFRRDRDADEQAGEAEKYGEPEREARLRSEDARAARYSRQLEEQKQLKQERGLEKGRYFD